MVDINPDYMVFAAVAAEAYRTATLYTTPSLVIRYIKESIKPSKGDLEKRVENS